MAMDASSAAGAPNGLMNSAIHNPILCSLCGRGIGCSKLRPDVKTLFPIKLQATHLSAGELLDPHPVPNRNRAVPTKPLGDHRGRDLEMASEPGLPASLTFQPLGKFHGRDY